MISPRSYRIKWQARWRTHLCGPAVKCFPSAVPCVSPVPFSGRFNQDQAGGLAGSSSTLVRLTEGWQPLSQNYPSTPHQSSTACSGAPGAASVHLGLGYPRERSAHTPTQGAMASLGGIHTHFPYTLLCGCNHGGLSVCRHHTLHAKM